MKTLVSQTGGDSAPGRVPNTPVPNRPLAALAQEAPVPTAPGLRPPLPAPRAHASHPGSTARLSLVLSGL